jgi:PBP1b-binding outer membrane lipoprotein LpoB
MTIHKPFLIVLYFAVFLVGCSESALESDTDTPKPKVLVNAGIDQSIDEQTTVTLSAQASGQSDALTYKWTVTPNLTITHSDTSVAIATFTAPITNNIQTYTFTVEVTDANGNKGNDTVVYQINPVNNPPSAQIQLTQFETLGNNQFPAGYEVTLDASTSTDSDSTDTDNPIAAYLWQQTAGATVLTGISLQGDSLAFTTPILDEANSVTINVTVTDQEGAKDVETVTLNIQSSTETLPEVNAGISHQVFSGESINLNGITSTSVAASEPLVVTWLNDSEKDPQIENLNSLQTVAIAPAVTNTETVTFTLRVKDAQGNSVDDSLTVTIKPLPTQPLNDTGVILQTNDSQIFSTYQADYPGQDGQRGQDIIHANGLSEKAGSGEQGFDFTRLDVIGDEVDDEISSWSCVRDNITGLIWESKSAAVNSTLHSSSHSYSWYQSDDEEGFDGDLNGIDTSCSITNCNTEEYIAKVNSQGLCNFRDWRLPTHNELLSILHFGKAAAPMIDANYFPNTTESLTAPVWYWTQDSSADGFINEQAQNAWAIDFSSGNDNFLNKSTAGRVRLVRAGR